MMHLEQNVPIAEGDIAAKFRAKLQAHHLVHQVRPVFFLSVAGALDLCTRSIRLKVMALDSPHIWKEFVKLKTGECHGFRLAISIKAFSNCSFFFVVRKNTYTTNMDILRSAYEAVSLFRYIFTLLL